MFEFHVSHKPGKINNHINTGFNLTNLISLEILQVMSKRRTKTTHQQSNDRKKWMIEISFLGSMKSFVYFNSQHTMPSKAMDLQVCVSWLTFGSE